MSLIRASKSVPELWIVSAYFTCRGVRFLSAFDESVWANKSTLFKGVRSSWLIFAKNSDLYFEVVASCSAFSSNAALACSTSRFVASTSVFCSAKVCFFFELSIRRLQLLSQRLALLQEFLGAHGCRDGIEDNSEALC